MDMFSIHPYPENSSIPPTFEHPQSTSIGLADYDKLVALLGTAFDGTEAAGLLAPDRLRRVRPPDGDPAGRSSGRTPAPSRRRRSRSTSRPRQAGTQTRSRSRPATRRCGCCSSSMSPTSRSSSGSRPESSTPTTRRNRASSRSRAQPSPPRRSAPTAVERGTARSDGLRPTGAHLKLTGRTPIYSGCGRTAAERPLGRDRVGARPRRLRGSHGPSRRRLGRALLRLSPLLRDHRRRRALTIARAVFAAPPRCVDRARSGGHLVRDGGVHLAVPLLEHDSPPTPRSRTPSTWASIPRATSGCSCCSAPACGR